MEKAKQFLIDTFGTPKRLFILGLIFTIPFLFLVWMSFNDWGFIGTLDDMIGREFYEERRPWLNVFFIVITRMGDVWFVALLTTIIFLLVFFYFKNRRLAIWYALTVAMGAGVLNQLLKFFFQRPRPSAFEHLVVQHGFSFPSGHAMGSVITYGALLFLIIRLSSNWKLPLISAVVLIPLIGLIGISRIYVGVHYPSDVIGGYSLGLATLSISLGLYSLSLKRREVRKGDQV